MLIVLAGLPGVGKSSIARALAREIDAVWLRIDSIEQALREAGTLGRVTVEGYVVGYRLAEDNLALGRTVIADSVNPIAITRDAWLEVGRRAGVRVVEVEVVCSDALEHRRRVETRVSDVAGLVPPDWQAVVSREIDPWVRHRVVIDTAIHTVAGCVTAIRSSLV